MWAEVDLAAVVARNTRQRQMALALAVAAVLEKFSIPPKSRKADLSIAVSAALVVRLLEAVIRVKTVGQQQSTDHLSAKRLPPPVAVAVHTIKPQVGYPALAAAAGLANTTMLVAAILEVMGVLAVLADKEIPAVVEVAVVCQALASQALLVIVTLTSLEEKVATVRLGDTLEVMGLVAAVLL